MKRKRKYNFISLVNLYLNFIFQRVTIIIFITSLFLMSLIIILMANPFYDSINYIDNVKSFHLGYFEQTLFIIELFNSILVATLSIMICINAFSFDKLFISYIPRYLICLAKIVAILLVLLILSLFEVFILYGIGFIVYPNFKVELYSYLTAFNIFLVLIFEIVISLFLTTLVTNIFTPMITLFIFLGVKLVYNNYNNNLKILPRILPLLTLDKSYFYSIDSYITVSLYIIIITILYISIYSIKDLNER